MSPAFLHEELKEICHAFGLGDPVAPAEAAFGGRLHHVWQIKTSRGIFALKLLNDRIMQKENICAAYERAEEVARSFASHKVPAVPALLRDGKCVHEFKNKSLMIYEWIEGKPLKVGTVNSKCAERMGEVLGAIYAIDLKHTGFRPLNGTVDPDQWNTFLKQAESSKHPLRHELKTNSKTLADWSLNANNAIAELQQNQLLSHGDLDQHNVIWSRSNEPSIIDWESASLQNPAVELLNLCLDWSGFPEHVPDREAFAACLNGYKRSNAARTELDAWDEAIHGEFAYLLFWLSFSLARSFESSGDEQVIASTEAANALRSLCLLDECRFMLLEWLRSAH